MSTDRDNSGEWVDRYREASAELGERPSASVRASILAAAAREVGAGPVSANAPRPIRPRWPLAAAAAVMLSTLAVMLAIRTNEEMPQFSAPSEAARGAADNVATPAAPAPPMAESPVATREAANQQAPERQRTPTPERSVARSKSELDSVVQAPREMNRSAVGEAPFTGRLKKESDSIAQPPRDESRPTPTEVPATARVNELKTAEPKIAELERAQRNVPAAASVPPPSAEPAVRGKLRAEQSAAGAAAPASPVDQATSDARRDAAKPAAPAPLSAAQEEHKQADESAAAWLERIIKLRREGRHVEAEAELKRFRERYPQVQPPAEALPPTGTR